MLLLEFIDHTTRNKLPVVKSIHCRKDDVNNALTNQNLD